MKVALWGFFMVLDVVYSMKREMLRRGLSRKTIKTYVFYVNKFLLFCRNKAPREFSKKDVREFLYYLQGMGLAGSSLNVAHNALRFMMIEILHKGMYLKIKFSKTPKRKPDFLTKEEVARVLLATKNEKHNLIVSLMYGAGLRVSEAIKLKSEDIDLTSMVGWVRKGKGRKDRPFIMPCLIKEKIARLCRQPGYLFPGRKGHLTAKSVQNIVEKAGKTAKIGKHIHPHMFRHSFTTHLLQEGEDVSTVQALLGHSHPETTLGYSHMACPKLINTKSPLDKLQKCRQ